MRKLILLLLLSASILAAIPGKNDPFEGARGRTISAKEAVEAIVYYPRVFDILAGLPVDGEFVALELNDAVKIISDLKNPLEYRAEVYDCDEFAFWFKAEAARRWAAEGHTRPLAIAVLMGAIILDDGSTLYHAWNGIVLANGKMVMVEPQGPRAFAGRSVVAYVLFNVII